MPRKLSKPEISKRIQITLAPNIEKMLNQQCKKKGISKSALVSLAIEKYVKIESEE